MPLQSTPPEPAPRSNLRPAHRTTPSRSRRGFAAMDPAKQLEIARKGGAASQRNGTGHHFTSEEARIAGKKGGSLSRRGPNKPKPQA